MRKLITLFASALTCATLFGDTYQKTTSQLYSQPTYAQVMKLIAAVNGNTSEHGPWDDGSVPASRLYSTPTYAQVDALIKAVRESGGGMRRYIRVIDFFDTFDKDADWYAEWADEHGYCTSMRYGNTYVRNYDWKYTEAMTYVGRLPAAEGRYASVFVCNVGTNLTPAVEAAGAWTRFHRALPGRAVDGINEKGVVCNINVVQKNGSDWETRGGARDLSLTRACRYVLDHFATANDAAEYVAAHGYVPDALKNQGFSIHMMIADERETCIVEDGMVLRTGPVGQVTPMTNYRVVNTSVPDPYGSGHARSRIMQDATRAPDPEKAMSAAIQAVWYTHAYVRGADGDYPWPDEFAGTVVVTNLEGSVTNVVAEETGSPWEHKLRYDETDLLQEACKFVIPDVPHARWPRNGTSWQTIHCSVYDISNRCLRIAVQEHPEWTVVPVPSGGVCGPAYVPSESDPAFSNAVLAVKLGFSTNDVVSASYVAVTNALAGLGFDASALSGLPAGGVYGSLGAILLALAAAVAWLKKNSLTGGLTKGVPDDPKVAALFSALAVSRSALSGKTYNMTDTEDIIRFASDVASLLGADAGGPSDKKTGDDIAADYGIKADESTTYSAIQEKAGLSDTDTLAGLLKQ